MKSSTLILLVCGALGCGSEETSAVTPPDARVDVTPPCVAGELLLDDGTCRAAGLPPDLPEPGPTHPPQAGVPADACADGFVSDGEGGCTALLPAAPCPDGLMAVPGDTACREVAPCGTGSWGDIPIESGTEFVDVSFVGTSDGSATAPWTTIQAAVDAAAAGDMVAIAQGTYNEDVSVAGKAVRIWGRCPALVTIVGVTTLAPAVNLAASGAELHTLAVTGVGAGVDVRAPGGAILDRLWIHDLDVQGIGLLPASEPTDISGTLVEGATYTGLVTEGVTFNFDRGEVRDTQVWTTGEQGFGFHIVSDPDTAAPSQGVISQSHIDECIDFGIVSADSVLEVRGTVIRGTVSSSADGPFGGGIYFLRGTGEVNASVISSNTRLGIYLDAAEAHVATTTIEDTLASPHDGFGQGINFDTGSEGSVTDSVVRDSIGTGIDVIDARVLVERTLVQRVVRVATLVPAVAEGIAVFPFEAEAALDVRESIVEFTESTGIYVYAANATVRESIVRDNVPVVFDEPGIALSAERDEETNTEANLLIEHSLVERAVGHAVFAYAGNLSVVSSIVRDTLPMPAGDLGSGVIGVDAYGHPASVKIYGSILENNRDRGIGILSSELDMEATVLRDTQPQMSGDFGRGMELVPGDSGIRTHAVVRWSVIENSYESGLFAWSSDLELRGVVVRGVEPQPSDPRQGFGVALSGGPNADPCHAVVVGSLVEGAHVAGVAVDASDLKMSGTLVRDMKPRVSDGQMGYGVFAQRGANVDVAWSQMERCTTAGIGVRESSGKVAHTIVRDIAANDHGELGDGLVLIAANVTLSDLLVEHMARAGLATFGAQVSLRDSTLLCNTFDVDSEPVDGVQSMIDDRGGNRCGCPAPDRECSAVSAGVAPPDPLSPFDQ